MELESFFHKLGLHIEEDQWERGDKLVESLKHGLEILGAAEALKGLKEMVDHTVEAAVGAKRLGQQIGFSTEAVQQLGYAASVSGSSAEQMAAAMGHLSRGMEEARTKGTGPLIDGLQAMHLSFSAIKGQSPEKTFEILIDHLSKMPDGFKKSGAAADIFGREAGPQLIPFINKGIDGIAALRKEADELGVVMGDEGVEQAEKFEEGQKRLGATLTGIKNQIVTALLPTLTEVFGSLQKWIVANKEIIKSDVEAAVKGMITVIKALASAVSTVADFVEENFDDIEDVLEIFGGILAVFAVESALEWLAAFWPLVAVGAVIGGVALLLHKLGYTVSEIAPVIALALAAAFGPLTLALATIAAVVAAYEGMKELMDTSHETALEDVANQDQGAQAVQGRSEARIKSGEHDKFLGQLEGGMPEDTKKYYADLDKKQGNATTVTVTSKPTIIVNGAGMPAEQIATLVDGKIKQSQVDANRQAIDAVKSGARK